jgi:hypothetical protein
MVQMIYNAYWIQTRMPFVAILAHTTTKELVSIPISFDQKLHGHKALASMNFMHFSMNFKNSMNLSV